MSWSTDLAPADSEATPARARSSCRRAAARSARRCSRPPSRRGRKRAGRSDVAPAGRRCQCAGCRRAALSARGKGFVVEPARADFITLLRNAALSISQAGYNTTIETLCCADRAVLVPFGTERETEQADRAALLAERGMVAVVPPGTLSPDSLADAVGRALAGPSLRSFPPCDANGGPATVDVLRALHERLAGRPFDDGGRALARGRPHRRAVVARRRCRRRHAGARPPARNPSPDAGAAGARGRAGARHAGAGRTSRRRARGRPAAARLRPRQPCPARRKEGGTRAAAAGHAGAGRARHRLAGAGAAVRQPRAARDGAALEPHRARRWCRPCRRSASPGLSTFGRAAAPSR